MLRTRRALVALIAALTVSFASAPPSQAALIQLFSPAGLMAGDVTYAYPARTTAGTQPVVPSPFVLTGIDNVLTFTELGGAFVRMDQEPSVPAAGGWFGTFAAATQLLYTGNTVDQNWFGPISVTFTRPILEFGVFAQFNDEFFVDPFSFTVYNGPTALNTFTRGVTSFPSFLGARATGADVITSILIRGPSLSAANNDFAIGPLTASTIPEPATLTLLGAGVVGSSWSRRRRSGRVSRE